MSVQVYRVFTIHLPYLGFSCYWCHLTDFLGSECIDDRALANIGVAYKSYTDLPLVNVKL